MITEIRRVESGDPELLELCAEQQAELAGRYADIPSAPIDGLDAAGVLAGWVARDPTSAGEPIGCVMLITGPVADGYPTGEVKRLYVRASHRGRGVGSQLMAALTAQAGELGARRIVLATGPRQPEAIALYGRLGWRRIPNWGGYRDISAVACFEQTLWADPPPLPADRPVRHRLSARAIVLDASGRVLLTHNVMTTSDAFVRDHWALPGGGIEDGETAREAATRELAEETGLCHVDLDGPVVTHDFWVIFDDYVLHQIEELWWGRSESDHVSRAGLHSDEGYLVGLQWWRSEDLRRTEAVTFPRLLADLVDRLDRHGTPAEPYVITADSTTPPGRIIPAGA